MRLQQLEDERTPSSAPLTSSWGGPWVPESAAPRGGGSLYTVGTTPGPCPPRGTRDSLWGPGPTPWPCPQRRGARGADAAPAWLGLPLVPPAGPRGLSVARSSGREVCCPRPGCRSSASGLPSRSASPPLPPAPHGLLRPRHCSSAGPGRARRGPRGAHLLRHRLMTLQIMSLEKCCLAIAGCDAIRFLTV